ncbi:unnamed protein product [Rhizophagus irregularis]|nr:unnamed protein product [Rhizophagus irregularis]
MPNVYTLNDIKDREGGSYKKPGHRLGSAYEQELEKKLRSVAEFNSEINDLSEKLVDKYNDREKEFQQNYADMENKASQLIASSAKVRSQLISERKSHSESQRELEAKYTAKIKSLKSNIKTLKREATLAQKASSADKVQILFFETKIRELEGKLEDIDLERTYHDLDAMGGVIEELAQISSSDPKEIDSLRLELERAKENLNSKKYTIECMEKGIESSNSIFRWEIDALYSARSKLREENRSFRDQLELKEKPRGASHNEVDPLPPPMNNLLQLGPKGILPTLDPTISVGGVEAVPLLATTPIIASLASLISPMVMYSILALLLIAVIWFVVRKC